MAWPLLLGQSLSGVSVGEKKPTLIRPQEFQGQLYNFGPTVPVWKLSSIYT